MEEIDKEIDTIKELLDRDLSHVSVVGRGLVVVDPEAIYNSKKFQDALKRAEQLVTNDTI